MMKRSAKILLVAGVVVTLPLLVWISLGILQVVRFVHEMESQMTARRAYMDSLTDTDIQGWIVRADTLLADLANNPQKGGDIPVSEDLKALKILRIDVMPPEYVGFVWVGGMDHTELVVHVHSNGLHTVNARYDDEHEKQLWPR